MLPTPAPTSPPGSPPQHLQPADDTVYPAPPQNAGSAPFHVLSGLFEKLQSERKPERRRRFLDAWFNHWREEVGKDLYPVLRLLLPQKDRERAVYGLKEKNLAKAYIKLIPLGMKDPDAIRLLNWKKPVESDKSSGDFPQILYEVVGKRSSVIQGTMNVQEVNDALEELSQNMGKQDLQSQILQRVYNGTTPEEQRWIVRIILKDMNISVKETTVFGVFHPDAHDLFNTCSDLKKVAWELWDPNRRLNAEDKTVQLFRSFAPMLCKRPTRRIEDSVNEMGGLKFYIEEKLDGERMQLHKRGNEFYYCSRKGKDYTYLYGKHVGTGSLTPYIEAAFDARVEDVILDGEMLVWDPVSAKNLPFGTLKTAALDKSKKEHNPRPCFKVFDLLYLNGMSLINKSTKFRKRNLRSCLTPVPGRIELVVEWEGKSIKDVRARMEDIMNDRGEGLILKRPDAEYVLNGRNRDWIKVKPEYMDNMGETVDVLVVAGDYGSGKRAGGVSSLICAVLDDRRATEDDDELKYASFVRVGSGFSFADYVWIRNKPWKPWDVKKPPSFYLTAKKGLEDKGDAYLEPEDSFIIKIKAAEIVPSDQYHMGFTMRFPRGIAIRDDLTITDCMTATELMNHIGSGKKRKQEEELATKTKKKRKATTKGKQITISEEYKGEKREYEVHSNLFSGMKFKVTSDPKSRTGVEDKKSLEDLIRSNGGGLTQVVPKKEPVYIVYGGTSTPYDIKVEIDKDRCDIIRPKWILDSIAIGYKVPMSKKYFFNATTETISTDEYQDEDDDADETAAMNEELADKEKSTTMEPEVKEETDETDSLLADWLKLRLPKNDNGEDGSDTQSDTEPESDNEDTRQDIDVPDDWEQVSGADEPLHEDSALATVSSEAESTLKDDKLPDVKMGDDTAMHYDQNLIFKHLCFYLDSPANARKHGMTIRSKHEAAISTSFEEVAKLIADNGGQIVDLDEPKLTHVVLDKRDDSRRRELISRTSKPKHRNLVISEWIQACLDEETLLDEEEYAP